MKRNTLLIVVLLLTTMVHHAEGQSTSKHEVRFGIGAAFSPSSDFYYPNRSGYDGCSAFGDGNYLGGEYKKNIIGMPSFNFSYNYQLNKWLSFGATLGYVGAFQNRADIYTDATTSRRSWHFIGFTPTVRFDWFRRNIVKLYSGAGLGLGIHVERERMLDQGNAYSYAKYFPSFDITGIGISVGKTVFGFGEVGVGTHGIIKVGVGYRLNNK